MGRRLGVNTVKAGFSVDIDLYDDFSDYCDSKMINKSRQINDLIRKFLKEKAREESYKTEKIIE